MCGSRKSIRDELAAKDPKDKWTDLAIELERCIKGLLKHTNEIRSPPIKPMGQIR
jgi:hypothetical protein